MKLFLIIAVLAVVFVVVVDSRAHLLQEPATRRTTLAAPTPTPEPTVSPPTTTSSTGSDGSTLFSQIGKLSEDFLKKLFSAGKSVGEEKSKAEVKA